MKLWRSDQTYATVEYNKLITFASQIEASIKNGNPSYFNHCFNTKMLLNNLIGMDEFRPYVDIAIGFTGVIEREFDPGSLLTGVIDAGGSFMFIRAYQEAGESKILFRLLSAEGISYHEYMADTCNGRIMINDGYIFNTGQTISEMFEHAYVDYISELYELPLSNSATIRKSMNDGNYRKAYHKWVSLPENVRLSESYQLLGIQIAEHLSSKKYFKVYVEYQNYFPEEPGKYLIPLNGLLQHGYEQGAIPNIDKLEAYIQSDPFLYLVRAKIYASTGDLSNAKYNLCKLIEEMPQYENGYFSLLDLYLNEKDFSRAAELLSTLMMTFNTYKEDLLPLLQNHPEFLESAEYKTWLEN